MELLSRFSWEAPQYTLGNIYSHVRNMAGNVDDIKYFRGTTVVNFNTTETKKTRWGLTLGSYINTQNVECDISDEMFRHEYGHTIQSRYSGPSYITKISIPSLLSGAIADDDEKIHNHDYTWFEIEANKFAFSYFDNHDSELIDDWDDINYPRNYSVLDWWTLLFNPLIW